MAPPVSRLTVTVMVAILLMAAGVVEALYGLIAERKRKRELDEPEA